MITAKISPKRARPKHTTIYAEFRGVDFSVDASLVSKARSPYAPNLIADIGGMPEKRTGWRVLHTLEQPINGIWYGEINGQKTFIAHGGTKIYKFSAVNTEVIKSDVNNARSTAFFMRGADDKGKIYILTGKEFLSYDGTDVNGSIDAWPYIWINFGKDVDFTGKKLIENCLKMISIFLGCRSA